MRELETAYRILELEPGASMEEVNRAYKDLVFVWHPDRIPQDNERLYQKAQDKIKALNHARDLLRSHHRQDHNGNGNGSASSNGTGRTTPSPYRSSTGYTGSQSGDGYPGNGAGAHGQGANGRSNGAYHYQNRYYRHPRADQGQPQPSTSHSTQGQANPSQSSYRQRRDAAAGVGTAQTAAAHKAPPKESSAKTDPAPPKPAPDQPAAKDQGYTPTMPTPAMAPAPPIELAKALI